MRRDFVLTVRASTVSSDLSCGDMIIILTPGKKKKKKLWKRRRSEDHCLPLFDKRKINWSKGRRQGVTNYICERDRIFFLDRHHLGAGHSNNTKKKHFWDWELQAFARFDIKEEKKKVLENNSFLKVLSWPAGGAGVSNSLLGIKKKKKGEKNCSNSLVTTSE